MLLLSQLTISSCLHFPAQYEFQAEVFSPPYVFHPETRPNITSLEGPAGNSKTFKFGEKIRVFYESNDGVTADGATITSPSAVTHGLEMNSKTAFLEVNACSVSSNEGTSGTHNLRGGSRSQNALQCIEVVLPKAEHRVTVSGSHMLFLLNGKSPSLEAKWIQIE